MYIQVQKDGFLEGIHPLIKLLVSTILFLFSLSTTRIIPLIILLFFLLTFLILCGLGKAVLRILPLALLIGGGVLAVTYLMGARPELAWRSALRIVFLLVTFLLFGATTRPITLMRSLNQLKIPPELGIGLLIVTRFLPILYREMEKIILSFKLRAGHRKKSWSLMYRGLIIPFIFRLFTLSDSITLALQMRAFESRPPLSSYKKVSVKFVDWVFLGSALAVVGVIVWRF